MSNTTTVDSSKMKTWERRINEAKKKHRPKLKDWTRDGFYGVRSADFELRASKYPPLQELSHLSPIDSTNLTGIDRISCERLSRSDFIGIYEEQYIPCVISDIPRHEKWDAFMSWNFPRLRDFDERYFKVGEDDDGYKVKVRMKYFLKYLSKNEDDSPLYIFDSNFDTDSVSNVILNEYKIPSYFQEDLFHLVGEKRRPPYRWFLVGPKRSGTCVHIDPLGTSAWNTLLQGRKRWVLFPPRTSKSIVKGTELIKRGEDDEAVHYFVDILPRIIAKHGHEVKIYEFIQNAGDTVFVPGGWWHAVLNLDDTIAITQVINSLRVHTTIDRKCANRIIYPIP